MDFRSPAPSSARLRWRGSRPCRRECPIVVDGLALGALPEAAEKIARRAPLVALVHHPLALEAGLSPADAQKLFESERKALAAARSVIVTSRATAKRLNADYDVPPERITVAPPGTDRAAPAKGSADGTLRLLSVGAVVPRKGFDVLIAALASIADTAVAADDRGRSHTLSGDGGQA